MAENIQKQTQYQYTANSNLVLQADRSSLPRRNQEPSGEPETLWGRINPKDFGDRAQRTINEEKEKREKRKKEREEKRKQKGYNTLEKPKKRKKERYNYEMINLEKSLLIYTLTDHN